MSERVWVITGASSGLGLATALYVLKQGDKVVVTVRDPSKFPQSLKAAGAHPLYLDMSSSDDIIRKVAADAIAVYGHVDVLVNNAATLALGFGPLEEIEIPDVRGIFQVNLFAVLSFTQPFVTHFRTRRTGHILNISSNCAFASYPGWETYGATKAALNTYTEALAHELKLFDVKVHLIVAGYFPSNIWPDDPEKVGVRLSEVYTDPETQGYDTWRRSKVHLKEAGTVGDMEKFAVRCYEIVAGVGLVADVLRNENHSDWVWVPLGVNSGMDGVRVMADKLDNCRAYEPIWRSVNVDAERLAGAGARSM